MDEIAARLSRDPLALRLKLLPGEPTLALTARRAIDRPRLVLRLAAEKSGWGSKLEPEPGRRAGRRIACNIYHFRSAIAQVAEVSVGAAGDVRVHRIVTAFDCGQVVNRLGLEAQIESGIAFGLSYALKGEVTIRSGRVAETNYREFSVLNISEMPLAETHLVDSDRPPSGAGEQPVPCVAPAVANAIFAATGRRLRKLPIRPEDLRS